MDEIKLKELWKSTSDKLEETMILNRKNTEEITKMKVQSFVASMKPSKIFTILVGILWVGFGLRILIGLIDKVSLFFLISAGIQIALTTIALVVYVRQLILINQVDITEPVLKTQEKLGHIKTSTLWITRLLFLQLPVWTTFYLNVDMLKHGNVPFLILQGIVTFSFTIAALWLFFNIKNENKDKKWFRLIFRGKEWQPLIKSLELLNQIEEYKIEEFN